MKCKECKKKVKNKEEIEWHEWVHQINRNKIWLDELNIGGAG